LRRQLIDFGLDFIDFINKAEQRFRLQRLAVTLKSGANIGISEAGLVVAVSSGSVV